MSISLMTQQIINNPYNSLVFVIHDDVKINPTIVSLVFIIHDDVYG